MDRYISITVADILDMIDTIESVFAVGEITADGYFEKFVDSVKTLLKESYDDSEFEKEILSATGFADVNFKQIENAKIEVDLLTEYVANKNKFMDLYNGNGFAEISKIKHDKYGADSDFDEFMEKEPKYDLKKCKLIKPNTELIVC